MPFDQTPEAQAAKARWLEALRSGKYEQGAEVLAKGRYPNPVEYCCLGVHCYVNCGDDWRDAYRVDLATSDLIPEHRFGLTKQETTWLADLNDGTHTAPAIVTHEGVPPWCTTTGTNPTQRKHSFAEIADLIEKYL